MAQVHPFRALRFNPKQIDSMEKVIAPPFDLIPYQLRQKLLDRHPHNVIRLILGDRSTFPSDLQARDLHGEAASTLETWKRDGILMQEDSPSMYLSEETFTWDQETRTRRSLFLTVDIEPLGEGSILPHERTLQGPIEDRLKLLEATQTHLSSVFMAFHDEAGDFRQLLSNTSEAEPLTQFKNPDSGVSHRLFRIESPSAIGAITEFLRPHPFLIADGHHRYTTAHRYHTLHPELPEAGRMMICLVSSSDPGLILGAIHRGVHTSLPPQEVEARIRRHAKCEPIEAHWQAFMQSEAPLAWRFGSQAFAITPKDRPENPLDQVPSNVFQDLILKQTFEIDPSRDDFIQHVKLLHSLQEVENGLKSSAMHGFWLRPMEVSEVIRIAQAGERLPQKATYFFPKVMSGLLLHALN